MSHDMQPIVPTGVPAHGSDERELALKRLKARREFQAHLVVYVVVNAFLVLVWWWTGAGYFWPGWVMAGWGIGIVIRAWDVFIRRPITEEDVQREMKRGGIA